VADLDHLSLLDARAAIGELDRLRTQAVDRGVEVVSVFDIAERVEELRAHERKKAAEAEDLLRQVVAVDARRNYGIGQEK
jgi:hypothetical protein